MVLKNFVRRRTPTRILLAWRKFKARRLMAAYDDLETFADEPVAVRRLPWFRREQFPASGPTPWLDRDDAEERIEELLATGELSTAEAALCRAWRRDGFVVLPGFFRSGLLDAAWQGTLDAIDQGIVPATLDTMTDGGPYEGRALDMHVVVSELREILHYRQTCDIIGMLLGRPARPFQSITFFAGSEQGTHSDSIHMTTYPEGYLVGAWVAMEDIHPDSGPLVYYPGSHRMRFYSSRDVGVELKEVVQGAHYDAYHSKYEPFIADLVESKQLKPLLHTPKKGDLLLWHANLLHGGTERKNKDLSRKSVVCHYFAEGAVCYHDLIASLARIS